MCSAQSREVWRVGNVGHTVAVTMPRKTRVFRRAGPAGERGSRNHRWGEYEDLGLNLALPLTSCDG